jgi:hypothetical protein
MVFKSAFSNLRSDSKTFPSDLWLNSSISSSLSFWLVLSYCYYLVYYAYFLFVEPAELYISYALLLFLEPGLSLVCYIRVWRLLGFKFTLENLGDENS